MYSYMLVFREARFELPRQIAVEFDAIEASRGLRQRQGQRPVAGTDFHAMVAGGRRDGGNDAVDIVRVAQKVLTEALARPMHASRGAHARPPPRNISSATSRA